MCFQKVLVNLCNRYWEYGGPWRGITLLRKNIYFYKELQVHHFFYLFVTIFDFSEIRNFFTLF